MKKLLLQHHLLNEIDIHFADYISNLQDDTDEHLWLLAAMLSFFAMHGNSALPLKHLTDQTPAYIFNINEISRFSLPQNKGAVNELMSVTFPLMNSEKLLLYSKVIGSESDDRHIIYEDGLFFLNKYYYYEMITAEHIKKRAFAINNTSDLINLKSDINSLFPENTVENKINYQKIAAIAALNSSFSVITGGPGTGKTTTAGKILSLLIKQKPDSRIQLLAPTGKAAERLNESLRKFKVDHKGIILDSILDSIPENGITIHKFLNLGRKRGLLNKYNRAKVDIVLIDEASMVSLPLFAKTFEALFDHCRIILLGDKNQLMSVDTGSVLKDITDAEELNLFSEDFIKNVSDITDGNIILKQAIDSKNIIQDAAVELEHSWRFHSKSGIGQLSHAVNCAKNLEDASNTFSYFEQYDDIAFLEITNEKQLEKFIYDFCKNELSEYYSSLDSNNIDLIFENYKKHRLLCAVNLSPFGVDNINKLIEQNIFANINTRIHYKGRPILITKNDYVHKLMNGDVGIILEQDGEMKAFFLNPNAKSSSDKYRVFNPSSLEQFVTAFAISIHKSQGSEFENVYMFMPNNNSKILSKELLYTGITRAKKTCTILGSKNIFLDFMTKSAMRYSGLISKLK
jgi:exodeoxyribonuclease V alpha subunit